MLSFSSHARALATLLLLGACAEQEQVPAAEEVGSSGAADTAGPGRTVTLSNVGFQAPETALYDDAGDVYLVSNINGGLTASDDNGFISRVSPDGQVLDLKWISGEDPDVTLHGPKGMIFKGDTLIVADVGAVRKFHRTTGQPLGEVPIQNTHLLNDLAVGPDGTVYVTDSGDKDDAPPNGAVYRLSGNTAEVIVKGAELDRPDGLIFDDGGLLVTPFGTKASQVYRLSLTGDRTPVLSVPQPQLDGLLRLPDGSLIITSWKGNAVYRVAGNRVETVLSGLETPAQVGYDPQRQQLLVPVLKKNELVIHPLR
jgi:sugar lactone lactonase YvrE